MAVLPVVRSIWESEFVDKASSSIVKCLIEILRTVLEGEMSMALSSAQIRSLSGQRQLKAVHIPQRSRPH
jgi:hypothetical protein